MNKYEVKAKDIFPVEGERLAGWKYVYMADDVDAHIAELEKSQHNTTMALKSELVEAHKAISRLNVELMAKDETLRRLRDNL